MTNPTFHVDFFCVGVAKAGTTTLHDLLYIQNGISLPKRKETNYFSFGISGTPDFQGPLDNTSVNIPTITSMDDYISDFDSLDNCVVGEVCPSYMLEGSAENIHAHNPNAKIIILLREPISRAFSNYQHLVRDGREHETFEAALDAEEDRLAKNWEWFWGLKRNSFYHDAVKTYLDLFGKENVMILLFEDFIRDQQNSLKQVLDFIGLDTDEAIFQSFDSNKSGVVSDNWKFLHKALLSEGTLNTTLRTLLPPTLRKQLGHILKRASTVRTEVNQDTRSRLAQELAEDLRKLRSLVGPRVGTWLEDTHVS